MLYIQMVTRVSNGKSSAGQGWRNKIIFASQVTDLGGPRYLVLATRDNPGDHCVQVITERR